MSTRPLSPPRAPPIAAAPTATLQQLALHALQVQRLTCSAHTHIRMATCTRPHAWCTRSQHGERGRAFGRRSPAHLDGLRSLLLHVPRSRSPSEHWVEDQPLLRRTRARVAFVREAAQHMGRTCGAWSKWTVQVTRPCSTTRSRAVGGVPQVDQCGTPSMVDTGQRETKSQLLQGKRCTARRG